MVDERVHDRFYEGCFEAKQSEVMEAGARVLREEASGSSSRGSL